MGKGDGSAESPMWSPCPTWDRVPHLGAGLCRPIDGHFGHPSEVGHAHLLGSAQHIRAEALIRHLEQSNVQARDAPSHPQVCSAPQPMDPAQDKSPDLSNSSIQGSKPRGCVSKVGNVLQHKASMAPASFPPPRNPGAAAQAHVMRCSRHIHVHRHLWPHTYPHMGRVGRDFKTI